METILPTQAINESKFEQMADDYEKKYGDYLSIYESKCQKAKAGLSVTTQDLATFGSMLERWDSYVDFCEANGTMAELGPMPNIALDIISTVQTKSILPLISSNQPIDEMQGTVYCKEVRLVGGTNDSGAGMGGLNKGDLLDQAAGPRRYDPNLGNGKIVNQGKVPAGAAADTVLMTLNATCMPGTLKGEVKFDDKNFLIMDDDRGNMMASGGLQVGWKDSSKAYSRDGQIIAKLPVVAKEGTFSMVLNVNIEAEPNMVTISSDYVGKPIAAEFFGLKSESGLLRNYAFQKRWGRVGEDEQAQDLANELNNVLNSAGVDRLYKACPTIAQKVVVWNAKPADGISVADHKLGFIDVIAQAESVMADQAGRGTINRWVAGQKAATYLRGLPTFVAAPAAADQVVGLYGYLDGVPVIRGIAALMDDTEMVGVYMGTGAFDAPMVHAPYLPIFVTSTLPVTDNPLRNQRGIATMAGLKAMLPQYTVKVKVNFA